MAKAVQIGPAKGNRDTPTAVLPSGRFTGQCSGRISRASVPSTNRSKFDLNFLLFCRLQDLSLLHITTLRFTVVYHDSRALLSLVELLLVSFFFLHSLGMQDSLPHWFLLSRSLRCTFWPDRGMIQTPGQGYMGEHRPENSKTTRRPMQSQLAPRLPDY